MYPIIQVDLECWQEAEEDDGDEDDDGEAEAEETDDDYFDGDYDDKFLVTTINYKFIYTLKLSICDIYMNVSIS